MAELDGGSAGRAVGLAPRLALLIVAVVFVGFVVNAFQYVVAQRAELAYTLPAAAGLVAMMVLQLGFFSNPHAKLRGSPGYLALAVQAALGFAPLAVYGEAWMGLLGFLAGDALLVLRPLLGWITFAAIAGIAGAIRWNLSGAVLETSYVVNLTLVMGLVVYGLSRLRSLVAELDTTRSELANLAVTEERLRFAGDLHDVLGFSLSAITLKAELASRLLADRPQRAKRELLEILGVSRKAHSDVRTIASSYRELSLDEELASARSTLTAADVVVDVHGAPGDLPPGVSTALATVLREGITNLLRHSEAERCDITFRRDEGSVTVEIVNDGVRARTEPNPERETGIVTLTSRVEALGGTLSAETFGDEFRLRATVWLPGDGATPSPEQAPVEHGPSMAPRLGLTLATAVFSGYVIGALVFVAEANLGPVRTIVSVACALASLVLVLGFLIRRNAPLRSPLGRVALLVQLSLSFLPIVAFQDPYIGLPGFAAGAALLVLPVRFGAPVFVAVVVCSGVAHWLLGGDTIGIAYGFLVGVNQGLVVFGLTRLVTMVRVLHDARSELADLAVFKERLRFARDLHDLLGYSLSAITLKSELAQRLVAKDPERVREELAGILDISRQALVDVRAVASSYRELSLDKEIESARDLLAAANIDVRLRFELTELSPDLRTTLAIVLREGVTNVLSHSKARNCELSLRGHGDRLVMEIVNDGVVPNQDSSTDGGNGIHNLSTRLSAVGGSLHTEIVGSRHRLCAEIPLTYLDSPQ